MNLRVKVILLATIPLIVAVSLISFLIMRQASKVSLQTAEVFKSATLEAKQAEVLNYMQLALTSIEHLYPGNKNWSDEEKEWARDRVKTIINGLTFGEDGYFFIYDFNGVNVVHPKQGWRVGENYWDLQDREGRKVIQDLITAAREGGGFVRYSWEQPSKGEVEEKIGYATALDELGWMLGTGIYIDDVLATAGAHERDVERIIWQTFLWIISIALIALSVVFVSWLAINVRESNLADRRLQALTQRLVEAQEEERGRVSRELHDSIGQILVAVKFTLERAARRPAAAAADFAAPVIAKASESLELAIQEVRRISHGLRPPLLDDLGLGRALEHLAEEFSAHTKISVDVQSTVFKNLLPPDAKTALYRIAQEALTNVERHSGATQVLIDLSLSQRHVLLTISDNGIGFPADMAAGSRGAGGIGLRNMQERAESFGGSFHYRSGPRGVTIIAKLPNEIFKKGWDRDDERRAG